MINDHMIIWSHDLRSHFGSSYFGSSDFSSGNIFLFICWFMKHLCCLACRLKSVMIRSRLLQHSTYFDGDAFAGVGANVGLLHTCGGNFFTMACVLTGVT